MITTRIMPIDMGKRKVTCITIDLRGGLIKYGAPTKSILRQIGYSIRVTSNIKIETRIMEMEIKLRKNLISFAKTLKLLTPDSDNNYTSNVTLVMNSPAGVSAK